MLGFFEAFVMSLSARIDRPDGYEFGTRTSRCVVVRSAHAFVVVCFVPSSCFVRPCFAFAEPHDESLIERLATEDLVMSVLIKDR